MPGSVSFAPSLAASASSFPSLLFVALPVPVSLSFSFSLPDPSIVLSLADVSDSVAFSFWEEPLSLLSVLASTILPAVAASEGSSSVDALAAASASSSELLLLAAESAESPLEALSETADSSEEASDAASPPSLTTYAIRLSGNIIFSKGSPTDRRWVAIPSVSSKKLLMTLASSFSGLAKDVKLMTDAANTNDIDIAIIFLLSGDFIFINQPTIYY